MLLHLQKLYTVHGCSGRRNADIKRGTISRAHDYFQGNPILPDYRQALLSQVHKPRVNVYSQLTPHRVCNVLSVHRLLKLCIVFGSSLQRLRGAMVPVESADTFSTITNVLWPGHSAVSHELCGLRPQASLSPMCKSTESSSASQTAAAASQGSSLLNERVRGWRVGRWHAGLQGPARSGRDSF